MNTKEQINEGKKDFINKMVLVEQNTQYRITMENQSTKMVVIFMVFKFLEIKKT